MMKRKKDIYMIQQIKKKILGRYFDDEILNMFNKVPGVKVFKENP